MTYSHKRTIVDGGRAVKDLFKNGDEYWEMMFTKHARTDPVFRLKIARELRRARRHMRGTA